jgi:putative transcriptional regulator
MLANQVKQARLLKGMTQEELAAHVSCTRQTIHSIENNRYNPSLELALKIAEVLEVNINNIFQLQKE